MVTIGLKGVLSAGLSSRASSGGDTLNPKSHSHATFLQVFIQKPLGVRFGRGRDGGAYVTSVDKANGNIDERIEVPDPAFPLLPTLPTR